MPRKTLYMLMAGLLVAFMAGFAAAGGYGHSMTEPAVQSPAGTEQDASYPATWEEREQVETGGVPPVPGGSPELRCCEGDSGPMLGWAGETVLRPEIDAGP